ncbi:21507_t:CDS:1, partial [Racocetra persica]
LELKAIFIREIPTFKLKIAVIILFYNSFHNTSIKIFLFNSLMAAQIQKLLSLSFIFSCMIIATIAVSCPSYLRERDVCKPYDQTHRYNERTVIYDEFDDLDEYDVVYPVYPDDYFFDDDLVVYPDDDLVVYPDDDL